MKRSPAIALLLASTLTTTACSHPRSVGAGVAGTLAVGATLGGLGAQLATALEDDEVENEVSTPAVLLFAGAAALAITSYVLVRSDSHGPMPRAAVEAPEPVAVTPPPGAGVVVVLPARATDAETLRLARQARRAASMRQCAAARLTLRAVASRDPAYHADLVATPAFESCR